MPACLIVRPLSPSHGAGGDVVVYRHLQSFLARQADVEVLELEPVSRIGQLGNIARGAPPEASRYMGADNRRRLAERLQGGRLDAVLFAHEAAFPLSQVPLPAHVAKVFYAHNATSLVARTDTALSSRLFRAGAARFDRRWFEDPSARVFCISEADRAGLRVVGVTRPDLIVAPPGAPPETPLSTAAAVIPELVLTGSYGWWRKRRDLKRFAAEPGALPPILASDPVALDILGPAARTSEGADWGAGLRFALITDRFLGGFKLKSLEYVAMNCIVLSYCDLGAEFAGLPHAQEFIRRVADKAEVTAEVAQTSSRPQDGLIERFRIFKAACLRRFDWDRCLEPIAAALAHRA